MATSNEDLIASDEIAESETRVLKDLNCPLCLKVFKSPRRLPCLHSFCQDCLQLHISNTVSVNGSVKEFCCPICGNIARSGEEIPTDKWVFSFPFDTLMLILMKSKVKVDIVCNVCHTEDDASPAEDLCIVCEEALCRNCSKVHRRSRLLTNHTILKIEELSSKRDTGLQSQPLFHCTEHAHNPVELYCKIHDIQLCAKCFIVSHKNCSEVIELTNDPPDLPDALNQVKEQMEELEDRLKTFTKTNLSNLCKLQSKVNELTGEIRTLKKAINDALEDLERRVKEEGDKILNKEKKRIEMNRGCQSHLMAIQNSNVIVNSGSKYATQSQMFLLAKKLMNQLAMSKRQIEDKYSKNDNLTLLLEVNPQLKSITKIPRGETGMLRMKRNDEVPIVTDGFKPLKEYKAELVNAGEIKWLNNTSPWYTKVSFTSDKQLLLVDFNNALLHLLDSSYKIVCNHTFPNSPWDICIVSEEVVAVTLPYEESIHLLSHKHNSITLIRQIHTRHTCFGITAYNAEELIVSGPCDDNEKFYWSLITLDGKEKSYHEFDCKGSDYTYVALNAFNTLLYISLYSDNCLHCFGMDGLKYFTFSHQDIRGPFGVAVDRDDNVYLVGALSSNILQLSPDGSLIQIILKDTRTIPIGICFDQTGKTFMLTYLEDTNVDVYALKDNDG